MTQVKFIVHSFVVILPIAVDSRKEFFILRIQHIHLILRKTTGHLIVINRKNFQKNFKIYKIK